MSYGGISLGLINSIAVNNGEYYQLELDLKCPIWVFVNPKYLTSESKGWSCITDKGVHNGVHGSVDHPYFNATREMLASAGWINMQTGWWNGDSVITPFYFNNILLEEGEQFTCGAASKYKFSSTYNDGIPMTPLYED